MNDGDQQKSLDEFSCEGCECNANSLEQKINSLSNEEVVKRRRCSDIVRQIREINSAMNAETNKIIEAENNISTLRSDLTGLKRELRFAEGTLLAAQVGSAIPGPAGRVGGVSIPVLEREVEQLRSRISGKENEIEQAKDRKSKAREKQENYQDLLNQLEIDSRSLGC